ncbi:MAG: hypothetical protein ACXADU_09255 [Promethearchaeota archaeon]
MLKKGETTIDLNKLTTKLAIILLAIVAVITIVVAVIPIISPRIKIISVVVSFLVAINIVLAIKYKIPVSTKLLIVILSIIIIINITIAFSYHMVYDASLIHGAAGNLVHHKAHRVIMIYHSLSAPFVGIVTLLFLDIFEVRKSIIDPIRYLVFVGGICAGIGATFWAYTNVFELHHIFLVGLVLLFLGAGLLCYGLLPGKEAKESEYIRDIPKIGGFDILSLSGFIVIAGIIVFVLFGLTAAVIMLVIDEPFFFIEEVFLVRGIPKTIYEELASFHMRLTTALFLTGILVLVFRYTDIKGKLAKIGAWLILPGAVAMTAGYFLMIFMGGAANAILMPARALILFAGVIISCYAWIQVSKEELGERYSSASLIDKIKSLLRNPLRFGMFIPFFLAGFVVVIPGLVIVADLEAYRELLNYPVEKSFATGHPHILVTLGAITIFCLLVHNLTTRQNKFEKLIRKIIGWSIIASQLIVFPIAAFYFLRSPVNTAGESAMRHIILSGLLILFVGVISYFALIIFHLIKNREKFSEEIFPLVQA